MTYYVGQRRFVIRSCVALVQCLISVLSTKKGPLRFKHIQFKLKVQERGPYDQRDNRQAVKALRQVVLWFGLDEVEVLVKVVELVMVKGRNRVPLHASPSNQCRETTKTDLLESKKLRF